MKLKFKPNVGAPRGTGGGVRGASSGGGDGVRGASGSSGKRSRSQREKRVSGGEDGNTTGGESSSEVEAGETSSTRTGRRLRTSSGPSSSQDLTSTKERMDTNNPQDKPSNPRETANTLDPSNTGDQTRDSNSHNSIPTLELTTQVSSTTPPITTSEPRTTQDEAVDKPSDLTSRISTSGSLVRKSASSTSSGGQRSGPGGGGIRMRKKIAPKVVANRPKRTSTSATTTAQESPVKETTQQHLPDGSKDVDSTKSGEKEVVIETDPRTTLESDLSSVADTQQKDTDATLTVSLSPTLRTSRAFRASRLTKEQSTDEAISNTLNEVLNNTHRHEVAADTGLSGIVPQLNLFANDSTMELQSDHGLTSDASILTPSSTALNSEQEKQDSPDQSQPNVISRSSTAVSDVSEDISTKEVSDRTNVAAKDVASDTIVRGRRGRTTRAGSSDSGRSRKSRSRTSSVCSEVDGGPGESAGGKPGRGRRRRAGTKRKNVSRDSTPSVDGDGQSSSAASTPSKKARTSAAKVREAPDRSTMTMQELIYYNPSANPMSSTVEEKKRKKDGEGQTSQQGSRSSSVQPPVAEVRQEDKESASVEDSEDRIVPQLRIGEDGNIIVDESSMLVETTEQKPLEEVSEGLHGYTTSASFRQRYRVAKWTKDETNTFYKALSQVGTDFTMMTLLIPRRSRKELKNKFKKEEKHNPHLISQALKNQVSLQKLQDKK